jgi:hypothetical protein
MLKFAPHGTQMVMHELAGPGNMVAVIAEVFHDGLGILEHGIVVPLAPEQVYRGVWVDSSQKAGSRWSADGVVAVSPFESHPGLSKSGDVRCPRLRMPCHTSDVVVEIVADDHHNIGLSPLIDDRFGIPSGWTKGRDSPYHQALQEITASFHVAFTRPTQRFKPSRF